MSVTAYRREKDWDLRHGGVLVLQMREFGNASSDLRSKSRSPMVLIYEHDITLPALVILPKWYFLFLDLVDFFSRVKNFPFLFIYLIVFFGL